MALFYQSARREPFLRAPPVVLLLIALLILIEAALQFLPPAVSGALLVEYGFTPARYSQAFLSTHHLDGGGTFEKAFDFVSYTFLHGSWPHVLINCVWLLAFGSVVARRFGPLLFLLFFVICGVAGAAAHLALNWGSIAPVIGASAAVSGLMAAAFRMMAVPPHGPLEPLFSRRILVWSAIWVAMNVAAGLTGLGAGPGVQLIAWQAHLGGYFAGLLLAGPFDALRQIPRESVRRTAP